MSYSCTDCHTFWKHVFTNTLPNKGKASSLINKHERVALQKFSHNIFNNFNGIKQIFILPFKNELKKDKNLSKGQMF